MQRLFQGSRVTDTPHDTQAAPAAPQPAAAVDAALLQKLAPLSQVPAAKLVAASRSQRQVRGYLSGMMTWQVRRSIQECFSGICGWYNRLV